MLSGISTLCFGACYAIAFMLEIVRLRLRPAWLHIPLAIATSVGLVAHTLFLFHARADALPISTADWLLWAAWVLALVYLAMIFYLPRTPVGLALVPIIFGLILGSKFAGTTPLATQQSLYLWGMFHGLALLFGTVTVSIGFLAGLMYLAQSYALKHRRSAFNRIRFPSLEWLERINSRTLGISAVLIALGFASGLVMSLSTHRGDREYVLWRDPVVLSLAAMLVWLVAAEVFRLVYPAARRGRKVAYLTLASFVFLVIVLASFTLLDNVHGGGRAKVSARTSFDCKFQIASWTPSELRTPHFEFRIPHSLT
jgi:ABC-type uncharacterized transport system permease subunit